MHATVTEKPNDQPRAWRCAACHLRLWIVLVLVLALDLASKHLAVKVLGDPNSDGAIASQVIPGILEFRTQNNEGAAFGSFQGQRTLFVLVGVLAVGVFVAMFARSRPRQWFMHAGIALVLAGALGNLYDRVVHHHVRDFIRITAQWSGREIYPPVFNVADIALVVGVMMIMVSSIRAGHAADRDKAGAR